MSALPHPHRCRHPLVALAVREARAHGLRVIETLTEAGPVWVVYRLLPNGRDTRLARSNNPARLGRLVHKFATSH